MKERFRSEKVRELRRGVEHQAPHASLDNPISYPIILAYYKLNAME